MPATAVGALVALLIAPGFLLVRGYERRTYRTRPDRDVYALAEAVVASAIWLGVVWVVLVKVARDTLHDYGVLPPDAVRLEEHAIEVVALGLAVVAVPYAVGVLAAFAVNRLDRTQRRPWIWLRWSARNLGFFKVPNAWDRAWLQLEGYGAGHVVLKMKDGSFIVGAFGQHGRVDVSPLDTKTVYLPRSHAHAGPDYSGGVTKLLNLEEYAEELEGTTGFHPVTEEVGVVVDGDEVAAVFFRRA